MTVPYLTTHNGTLTVSVETHITAKSIIHYARSHLRVQLSARNVKSLHLIHKVYTPSSDNRMIKRSVAYLRKR